MTLATIFYHKMCYNKNCATAITSQKPPVVIVKIDTKKSNKLKNLINLKKTKRGPKRTKFKNSIISPATRLD